MVPSQIILLTNYPNHGQHERRVIMYSSIGLSQCKVTNQEGSTSNQIGGLETRLVCGTRHLSERLLHGMQLLAQVIIVPEIMFLIINKPSAWAPFSLFLQCAVSPLLLED